MLGRLETCDPAALFQSLDFSAIVIRLYVFLCPSTSGHLPAHALPSRDSFFEFFQVKGIRFNQKKGKWVFKDGKTSQENGAIPNVPASEIRYALLSATWSTTSRIAPCASELAAPI